MVKYIKDRADQLRIVKSCHVDPTSGHLGVYKENCWKDQGKIYVEGGVE